jgi:hypothetical protein
MQNRLNLVIYAKLCNIHFCISIVWIKIRTFFESDFEYAAS